MAGYGKEGAYSELDYFINKFYVIRFISCSLTDYFSRGDAVLELRPTCENCNCPLPPDSLDARICSYECTFCDDCVNAVLENVCPNCGGGFSPRPIRPSRNLRNVNYLGKDPAITSIKYKPVDTVAHALFAASIKSTSPEKR